MVRSPRRWFLTRAHHPWTGLLLLALLAVFTYAGRYCPHWVWTGAVAYAVASFLPDTVGHWSHLLWGRGWGWQDTICPCCDGGGGWWPDFPDLPDGGPEDHGRQHEDTRTPSMDTVSASSTRH
ncbi:hypothetical protein OHA46_33705 (plasmid) [Streptomyces sp. NBC_00708]